MLTKYANNDGRSAESEFPQIRQNKIP